MVGEAASFCLDSLKARATGDQKEKESCYEFTCRVTWKPRTQVSKWRMLC